MNSAPILDAHVTVGVSRDAALSTEALIELMDKLGIDEAVVSPPERCIPLDNHEGNMWTTELAGRSGGRLLAYAVASPWLGTRAMAELKEARKRGAVALKVDPALQGFDLLDGLVDPLIVFAIASSWPVYVRSGTPPHALPLQIAALAERYPKGRFIMGRSGAADFSGVARSVLLAQRNVYADTAYLDWPVAYAETHGTEEPSQRIVFSTDAPFGDPQVEFARVSERVRDKGVQAAILGGTLAGLLPVAR